MKKVAILITCHNRKNKTLACLNALKISIENSDLKMDFIVYLVDDGSTDGTAEAVSSRFSDVVIISGNGNLFWTGGMRLAWKEAKSGNPDYYLLLNDDTYLFADSINKIIKTSINFSIKYHEYAILVGSTIDAIKGKVTYGGRKLISQNKPKSLLISNNKELAECDLGNANIMLVPNEIIKKIGFLSDKYTHSIADYDYTLRAKKNGFHVFAHPGILGSCEYDHSANWLHHGSKLSERLNYLKSIKGLAYGQYLQFIKEHFPWNLPEAFLKLWLKTLFPIVYDKFKKEEF